MGEERLAQRKKCGELENDDLQKTKCEPVRIDQQRSLVREMGVIALFMFSHILKTAAVLQFLSGELVNCGFHINSLTQNGFKPIACLLDSLWHIFYSEIQNL